MTKYIVLPGLLLVFLLTLAPIVWSQDEDTSTNELGTFGFGLESTGSACCISIRFWVAEERGSEMVLNAYDTHLFVTLRGLQTIARFNPVTAYTGVGMTLRFGDIVVANPFSAFMAMQAFIALETKIPFYESLSANIEASVEIRPPFGFATAIGIGVHFYF